MSVPSNGPSVLSPKSNRHFKNPRRYVEVPKWPIASYNLSQWDPLTLILKSLKPMSALRVNGNGPPSPGSARYYHLPGNQQAARVLRASSAQSGSGIIARAVLGQRSAHCGALSSITPQLNGTGDPPGVRFKEGTGTPEGWEGHLACLDLSSTQSCMQIAFADVESARVPHRGP